MIAEEKQKCERNNAVKFQSVWFQNALAVTKIPQLGHWWPSQIDGTFCRFGSNHTTFCLRQPQVLFLSFMLTLCTLLLGESQKLQNGPLPDPVQYVIQLFAEQSRGHLFLLLAKFAKNTDFLLNIAPICLKIGYTCRHRKYAGDGWLKILIKFVFESTATRHINHFLKDQDITGEPKIFRRALFILYIAACMVILFYQGFYSVCVGRDWSCG